MALGQLAGNAASGALLLAFAPFVPRPGFDRAIARRMLTFGVPLALTSLVEYVLFNADYVVVGRALGPVALGLYLLAYNISGWPAAILIDAVRRVSIVGFTRLDQDDARSAVVGFERTFALLLVLATPISLGLAVLAGELVRLVYGDRWTEAAEVLRYLAVLGCIRVAVGYVFDLLIGLGRSRTTLVLKLVWLVVLVPALVIGAEVDGIRGVALAHVVVGSVVAMPLFLRAAVGVGVDPAVLRRACVRPAAGLLVAGSLGWWLQSVVSGDLARLLVIGSAMAVAYLVVTLPLGAMRERGAIPALLDLGAPG
jgi:PST family polysaccharide transporter